MLQLPEVPTLSTEQERQYLYEYIKNNFTGQGAVVEVGTWFGASAYALAAGIRDSGQKGTLYCFDRFSEPGQFETVQKNLAQIYKQCVLIKTEIADIKWPLENSDMTSGPGLALVHLDAPKRWSDILYALKVFAPYLIPGVSIIAAQDFAMPRAYALPLLFYKLRDSFELVTIPSDDSTMAVFRVKNIPAIDQTLSAKSFLPAQADEIFSYWAAQFPNPEQRDLFELARAFYLKDFSS